MVLHTSFDVFSGAIEQYESAGWSVRDVEVTAGEAGDGTLHARLTIPVPLAGADNGQGVQLAPDAGMVTEDGTLRVEFSMQELFDLSDELDAAVTLTERTVRLTDDDEIVLTVGLTIEPTEETASTTADRAAVEESPVPGPAATTEQDPATADPEPEEPDQLSSVRDESVPPYEDTEYLRHLYESCSTFAEMSWQIDMDVSAETVRRYMIQAGIHDPNSYDTTAAGDASDTSANDTDSHGSGSDERRNGVDAADTGETTSDTTADHDSPATDANSTTGEATAAVEDGAATAETGAEARDPESADSSTEALDPEATLSDKELLTDGIGLPATIEIEDVADAVVEATTVYEVQQRLGIGMDRTRDLLKQLNLLDLVLHRVSSPPRHTPSYEMVATRIDQCTAEKA
jgi:hypothetical protein